MHLSALFGTEINLPRAQEIREMIHVICISPRYSISCFKAPLFLSKIKPFLFQQYNAEQINHLSKKKNKKNKKQKTKTKNKNKKQKQKTKRKNKKKKQKQKTKTKNNCGVDVLSKHYFKSV